MQLSAKGSVKICRILSKEMSKFAINNSPGTIYKVSKIAYNKGVSNFSGIIFRIFQKYEDKENIMLKRIVFLSVNPWENVQPIAAQGWTKNYYQQVCEQKYFHEDDFVLREQSAPYGGFLSDEKDDLFESLKGRIQILYVKSNQKEILQKVFEKADLVIVGIPASRKECDKVFMQLLPWLGKILFLWNGKLYDQAVLKRLKREYGLAAWQFMEAEKLPSFLKGAVTC